MAKVLYDPSTRGTNLEVSEDQEGLKQCPTPNLDDERRQKFYRERVRY